MTKAINLTKNVDYVPPESALGERIKEKRKLLKLTVEALASLTALYDYVPDSDGVSPPTIYRYESGKSKPSAREIRLLCMALNVSPCWLITGEEWNTEADKNADLAKAVRVVFNQLAYEQIATNTQTDRDQIHSAKLFEILINDNLYESPTQD